MPLGPLSYALLSLCVYVLLFPPAWPAYPGTESCLISLEYSQVMLLSSRRISTHEEHLALKDIPSHFVTQFPNGPEGSRKENFVPSQHFLPPRRISLLPPSQTQWTACPPLALTCSAAMTAAGLLPVLRLVDPLPSLMPSLIGKCAGDALSGSVAVHFPSLVRGLFSPGRGVRFDGISGLGKVG